MTRPRPAVGLLLQLEGVLVDATAARDAALVTAFAAEGLAWPTVAPELDPATTVETAVHTIAATHIPPPDDLTRTLLVLRAEREFAARLATGILLAEGGRDTVFALAGRYPLGIVTAWRRTDAERTLGLAGLDAAVRFVVAGDDGVSFDAGRRFARAVARLRASGPARPVVAVVADAPSAAAAVAAGARAVLVPQEVRLADLTPDWLDGATA